METAVRHYNHPADYEKVGRFLVKTYSTRDGHINWVQPRWEYMNHSSLIRGVDLKSIGVWATQGEIVGVVHPEHSMGTAYFEIDPEYNDLKGEMLQYAEEHISSKEDGVRRLRAFINDHDDEFQSIATDMGYTKSGDSEPMSHIVIPNTFPAISLPTGFRLKSLAEDNDLRKVDRVLWRGFNHGDEPPRDGLKGREFMQSAPNHQKDLNIVVEAPDGNFVSYCGMWYEPVHSIAYIEPVATDPDYRRMGLASAAVMEGVRRCGKLGATVACVGSTKPLYLSLGFRKVYNRSVWQRLWS